MKSYYRWVICFACTLVLFCTGGLTITGFTVYVPYMISEAGLTNSEMSAVLMLRSLFTLISMFVVVKFIRKFDIKLVLALSVLGVAASFVMFGLSHSLFMYAAAAALTGFFYGLGGMVPVSVIIQRWFTENEGLALGICAAGTGLSAVIGTPLITSEIERHSIRSSFLLEAAFVAVIAVLVFMFVKNYPSKEKEMSVREARLHKMTHKGKVNYYRLDVISKWLVFVGVFLTGASFNASPFLTVLLREKNFDALTAAYIVSFMGIALCLGKCVYGFAVDKLGRFMAGNLFHGFFVLGVALSGICPAGNSVLAYIAMLFLGMGFPMLSVGLSELAEGIAREEYYADSVKQFQIIYMIGSLAFGIVPGVIADRTGSYVPAYIMLAVIALLSALLQQNILRKERSVHEI